MCKTHAGPASKASVLTLSACGVAIWRFCESGHAKRSCYEARSSVSHFYTAQGQLVATVPMRTKGREHEYRDATLSDGRELNLGPSVTTVLQLLAKPGLTEWQIEQGIKAALSESPDVSVSYADPSHETYTAYIQRLKRKATEVVTQAADMGTQIHRAFEQLATGAGRELALDVGVAAYQIAHESLAALLDAGLTIEQSEVSFASPRGYGGTADILGTWLGRPCIADVKSQEFDRVQDAKFYNEHPLQLAGYAVGINQEELDRVSLIVSRTKPGVVAVRNWSTYESKNGNGWPNERADAAWLALLECWFLMSGWRPAW